MKLKHVFLVVMFGVAVSFAWLAYRSWPAPHDEQRAVDSADQPKKNAKPDPRGTEKSPLIVRVLSSEGYEKVVNEHLLVWAAISLAGFTFALACFTAYLWASTSELVSESRDTARRE